MCASQIVAIMSGSRNRYNIALHARKGGTKRWFRSNYQPPAVKKARAETAPSVRAVIVILASSKAGVHFPQQRVWFEWARDTCAIGFAVYMEDHAAFERQCETSQWSFWRPFLCPLQASSAWGEFSLLHAELCALKWAQQRFEGAPWFYVVSGDSVPTKTPALFVRGPHNGNSILGFDPEVNCSGMRESEKRGGRSDDIRAPEGYTILEHSQWKVLSRKHVCLLVKELLPPTIEAKWKDVARSLKQQWCCGIAADEWVIGTFLRKFIVSVGNSESKCEDDHINNDNSSTIPR
jgi:hypothetical protein